MLDKRFVDVKTMLFNYKKGPEKALSIIALST